MRIICDSNNVVLFVGSICEFGFWEDEPNTEKWKIEENYYALDNGYLAHGVNDMPTDFCVGKYLYINGEFVKNPDYVEPPKTDSERIAELEAQLEAMANAITEGVNAV